MRTPTRIVMLVAGAAAVAGLAFSGAAAAVAAPSPDGMGYDQTCQNGMGYDCGTNTDGMGYD
ncbi:hypothetical protein ALI144C_26855 [Actinosynnema sp. ALI-1.44]|uniref:hypothetical protein n=1 Tax=Actinosynnema sp. ALI-1.44 TaxID=1933779 RepID=UPI00097C5B76|nr:hypothetical protein [Actinosynnema sp. ALI-1.44]ONI79433.1 hypothetical protein ALI144C_26855 [Actinosynnema sp. ALI-1.44]